MISVNSNVDRLQQKLQAVSQNIPVSIAEGVVDSTDQMIREIDRFMFVPLRFVVDVNRAESEIVAKVEVELDRPRFGQTRRGPGKKIDRLRRRLSRKAWTDHVDEQVDAANKKVVEVVRDYIREELQK